MVVEQVTLSSKAGHAPKDPLSLIACNIHRVLKRETADRYPYVPGAWRVKLELHGERPLTPNSDRWLAL
jgi:hypothetical protein